MCGTREHPFDIGLLTDLVLHTMSWLRDQGHVEPLGLLGLDRSGGGPSCRGDATGRHEGRCLSRG